MEARKFLLKENTVLWVPARHQHLTNANLTDEIALELLKSNKKYLQYFKEFPADWATLLDGSAPASATAKKGTAAAASIKSEADAKESVKKAVLESIEEMSFSELKEYAEERAERFPEWKKHKGKGKLSDYIIALL